ncbi:MAG TPA: carboxypeptidase regulatory-like domain-containing protein [Anaerolineaceae bacterium]|nr:carboxypeptidase regulatory-like domain-containing protein [Anaerolineaceae bacterium]HPN51055.1 carboxypeptidase regulatory-like domain-containing protein [Anaerolineaceae bacterium]
MSPHKKLSSLFSIILLVGILSSMVQPVSADFSAAPLQDGLKPQISYDLHHDLSAPLTALAAAQQPQMGAYNEEIPMLPLPKVLNSAPKVTSPDAALQNAPLAGSMPELITSFDGVNNIGGVAPPDTQGDIGYDPGTGKKYYMQWVNLHIQAWDVTEATAPVALFTSPIAGNSLWAGFGGPCETSNDGDPIVLYDEIANRWMISQFAVNGPYYNCMAISQTSNPAGAYYRYAFLYSNTKMNDYPKFGIWPDGYYMTVNQFTGGSSWGGAGVAVYERDQMLTGGTARQVIFDLETANSAFGGMLPADFEGTPPAAGTPNYFAEVDDSSNGLGTVDEMRIWHFHTDWAGNTFSFGNSGQPDQVLVVSNFNPICTSTRDCVSQPNAQKLDAIGDRLMYRLAYRQLEDGTTRMVVNHTVDAGSTRAAVRWYELQTSGATWTITQQGTYAGDVADATHRWMGSISMDRMGNLALGYSMSSTTMNPSIGLVGRLNTDPANVMAQGERVAFSGTAAQSGVNRWGDYSSMSIDPQDGCTFWFTTEYSTGSWDWATRIVAFKYPGCFAVPTGKISGTVTNASTSNPVAGARLTAGIYGGISAADGAYTITAPGGTYDMTVSAYGYLPASATGIVVATETTTTQNFALTPAPMHTVSGTVTDGTSSGHTWPLYARLTIAGYPGGDIYTDPETGTYSVSLPEGDSFDFSVQAMLPGYNVGTATVLVPASDSVQDFALTVNVDTCQAPGYAIVGGMKENFDGVTAGSLPANWTTVKTAGSGTPAWSTNAGTRNPSGVAAVSAPNVAYFNSYDVTSGNKARLTYSLPLDMTSIATDQVSFQVYHDTGFNINTDSVQVTVSTDGGATWTPVGSPIFRYTGIANWKNHIVNLSAYATVTNLLIGFEGFSAYGNDVHIDDVVVGSAPECVAKSGGLLLGKVVDANTTLPLDKATIVFPGGSLTTASTPADASLADGFYYGFVSEGTQTVAASKANYAESTAEVTVTDNAVVRQNFSLQAGILSASPAGFSVSLPMNSAATQTLTLGNTGTVSVDYEIKETNLAPRTAAYTSVLAPSNRHLGPKNFNKYTLEGVAYYLFPDRSAPQFENAAAGTVISTITTGLTMPWGVGVNLDDGHIWTSNIKAGGGDNLDYEFTPAGAKTGRTIDTAPWVTAFAADMTYDPAAGTLWQINVNGDNCIYELDPASLAATGQKICPSFGTSQRGLAYDPASDTFLAGSWNDSIIVRFNRSGAILEQVNVSLPIAGLAYNPATGHLFVTNSGISAAYDISVLDANNNYANLGGFNVTGLHGGEAGLDIDCNGYLWAANQSTGNIFEVDSGETGVCNYLDIPWLSESPVSGALAISATEPVSLSFDATGLQPGTYTAQLKLSNNTPYRVANVPVTLTVTMPAAYGTVEGVASGLGVCDATPGAPLKGATVEVRNTASVVVATLTTGADGHFQWADRVADNDYTLTISKAGYIAQTLTVTLQDGLVVTQNATLRLDAPCLAVNPASIELSLPANASSVKTFTLTNSGAIASAFEMSEVLVKTNQPIVPGLKPAEVLLSEGFEGAAFPPADWTLESSSTVETWKQSTSSHSGSYSAHVEYDYDQDEWLLTPEYALATGTLSVWSNGSVYWCKTTFDNCDLNVWLVVGEVGGGDDVFVGKLDDVWTTNWAWAESIFDLTSILPGQPVRIGFQYLGNDGAEVTIDDITLNGETGLDVAWLNENPVTGTLSADGGFTTVSVSIDSTGLTPGTYTAEIRITDAAKRKVSLPVKLNVNGAPVAVADAYLTDQDTTLTVNAAAGVLANDVDSDSVSLTVSLVTDVQHGSLTLNADGSFTYTPAPFFSGADTFTYKVNDGFSDSNVATVTITVDFIPNKMIFLPFIIKLFP